MNQEYETRLPIFLKITVNLKKREAADLEVEWVITKIKMSQNQDQYQYSSSQRRMTIITLGDPCVGKTCLIKRFCERRFENRYIPTVGVDYGVKGVIVRSHEHEEQKETKKEDEVRIDFFDFSGDSDYNEVRNEFHQGKCCFDDKNNTGAIGVLLVFDATKRSTFDALPQWIIEAHKFLTMMISSNDLSKVDKNPIVLVANKIDEEMPHRQVSVGECKRFAESNELLYYCETSSKTGGGVDETFERLIQVIHRQPGTELIAHL